MPGGSLRDKIEGYYQRFYQGDGILSLVSKGTMKMELIGTGFYPEPPGKPTKYSEYTYFADMGKALARIVSIFFNQKAIGPPTRTVRRPVASQDVANDDSSDDDEPTQRPRRTKSKRTSTRTTSDTER